MRVISLIRRPQGHTVRMDGQEYAFHPPQWACECKEPAHIDRFRAIKEGYRLEVVEQERVTVDQPGLEGLEAPGVEGTSQEGAPQKRSRRRMSVRHEADAT